jgi:hypothetical protein
LDELDVMAMALIWVLLKVDDSRQVAMPTKMRLMIVTLKRKKEVSNIDFLFC